MIEVSLDPSALREFKKDLEEIKKSISSQELNRARANNFKQYTKKLVKKNQAGLKPISSATRILTGDHNPIDLTGKLLEAMEVRDSGKTAAEVGYFPDNLTKVFGKNITYTKLAELQNTGYRIPLTGEKGRKVRAWLAMNGLNMFGGMGKFHGASRQWIIVPARPFFWNSFFRFNNESEDERFAKEYLDKVLGK